MTTLVVPAMEEEGWEVRHESFVYDGLHINGQDFLPPRRYGRSDHAAWLLEQRAGIEALPDGVVPWALRRLLRMYSE